MRTRFIIISALVALALAGAGGWFITSGGLARLGKTASADLLDQAWKRVRKSPQDGATWAALGEAQAAEDQLEAAEHSYRTAIRIGGANDLAFANLGFLLYAQGKDTEARSMLNEARLRGSDAPMLDYTLAQLGEGPKQAPPRPTDDAPAAPTNLGTDAGVAGGIDASQAELPPEEVPDDAVAEKEEPPPEESGPLSDVCTVQMQRTGRGGAYRLNVEVENTDALLIVDTGASMTVLSADFIDRIGIVADASRPVTAMTANGRTRFLTAVVGGIRLGDREVEAARVAVCESCGVEEIADGLLGLDLQAAFGMELDLVGGLVRFRDCR